MISINVSDSNIYIATVTKKRSQIYVSSCKSVSVPMGLFGDDGGIDKDALEKCLREEFNEYTGKDCKEVAITFSALPVVSNEYTFPFAKKESELLEMIKSKVFQTLSADQYFIDYKVINTFVDEGQKKCTVISYVVPRKIVISSFDVIESLGKTPMIFGISQNSIYKFTQTFLKEKVVVIANITKKQLIIHLMNLPDNIITRSTMLEENNKFDILGSIGLSESVDPTMQIYDQLSKIISYQAIKYTDVAIETIYLMGSGADTAIKGYLADNLSCPVELLSELTFPFEIEKDFIDRFAYGVGTAI